MESFSTKNTNIFENVTNNYVKNNKIYQIFCQKFELHTKKFFVPKIWKNPPLLWKLYQILNFTWNEGVMTWQCQKMFRVTHNHMRPMVDVQDEPNRAKFQSYLIKTLYSDILDLYQSKTPLPPTFYTFRACLWPTKIPKGVI